MSSKKNLEPKVLKEVERKISLLDLSEPTLEHILEWLTPAELCKLAQVCSNLRIRCRGDSLWEKHIKRKWGKLIGVAVYQEWKWHLSTRGRQTTFSHQVNGSIGSLKGVWPILCFGSFLEHCKPPSNSPSEYSMMAWYFYLEKGKFWFPAQVYTSDDLNCYDALLSYDCKTDLFKSRDRYSEWELIEENIPWNRLRAASVQIPHVLHVSDCLNDLKPGDHIEVQWRSCKDLPYEWWYAIVGHLESCNEDDHCNCHLSDMLIMEFKQYAPGSHYRRTVLDKMNYGEQTFGGCGFYGGIRKLQSEEIEKWRELWPTSIVESVQT